MNDKYGNTAPPKTCYEIWQSITDRIMTATIFHSDASEVFDFMALKGFKRLHQYQALSEEMTRDKLKKFFINNKDKMLKDLPVSLANVIPDTWYDADRYAVTPSMRKDMTVNIFTMYLKWETESLAMYESCVDQLMKLGKIDDANYIQNELVVNVRKELKKAKRKFLEFKGMDWDAVEMFNMQQEMHDYYKNKIKNIGKKYCD